ncbi:hypothetical protein BD289DRAFT_507807 [Coniella lustricola]|uniref:Uncharacterized protein n=1 Tax=Coniella lustricola TaxID=2025994 RepID=A0A2T3A166_9PEZI|nr:hypothetical protein BD289DRAFT_507807 [Coniella lustricola]
MHLRNSACAVLLALVTLTQATPHLGTQAISLNHARAFISPPDLAIPRRQRLPSETLSVDEAAEMDARQLETMKRQRLPSETEKQAEVEARDLEVIKRQRLPSETDQNAEVNTRQLPKMKRQRLPSETDGIAEVDEMER